MMLNSNADRFGVRRSFFKKVFTIKLLLYMKRKQINHHKFYLKTIVPLSIPFLSEGRGDLLTIDIINFIFFFFRYEFYFLIKWFINHRSRFTFIFLLSTYYYVFYRRYISTCLIIDLL